MHGKQILIVDDHALIRRGVKALLHDLYTGIQIDESQDADTTMAVLEQKHVDMTILDLQMGETDTISLVEGIRMKYPATNILIFSMLSEAIYGRRLLKAGAKGFLPKSASLEEMKRAVDLVLYSQHYMSAAMIEQVSHPTFQIGQDIFARLSPREIEITRDLLSGSPLNTIARRSKLGPSTVGTYKARIFLKLQIQSVLELRELARLYSFNG